MLKKLFCILMMILPVVNGFSLFPVFYDDQSIQAVLQIRLPTAVPLFTHLVANGNKRSLAENTRAFFAPHKFIGILQIFFPFTAPVIRKPSFSTIFQDVVSLAAGSPAAVVGGSAAAAIAVAIPAAAVIPAVIPIVIEKDKVAKVFSAVSAVVDVVEGAKIGGGVSGIKKISDVVAIFGGGSSDISGRIDVPITDDVKNYVQLDKMSFNDVKGADGSTTTSELTSTKFPTIIDTRDPKSDSKIQTPAVKENYIPIPLKFPKASEKFEKNIGVTSSPQNEVFSTESASSTQSDVKSSESFQHGTSKDISIKSPTAFSTTVSPLPNTTVKSSLTFKQVVEAKLAAWKKELDLKKQKKYKKYTVTATSTSTTAVPDYTKKD